MFAFVIRANTAVGGFAPSGSQRAKPSPSEGCVGAGGAGGFVPGEGAGGEKPALLERAVVGAPGRAGGRVREGRRPVLVAGEGAECRLLPGQGVLRFEGLA